MTAEENFPKFDSSSNVEQQQSGGKPFADRPKFQGNWSCADCGAAITELPFQPREGSTVRCLDCYRKTKPARNDQ